MVTLANECVLLTVILLSSDMKLKEKVSLSSNIWSSVMEILLQAVQEGWVMMRVPLEPV